MNVDWKLVKAGLWENTQDALRHAAEHFRAYSESRNDSMHDLKWGILSVHQAAECFSNILIIDITPDEKELIRKNQIWFPSLPKSIELLLDGRAKGMLSNAEIRLISIYKNLSDIRNQLTHRTLPTSLDASDAAIALLGTLKVATAKMGPCLEEFNFDTPSIESGIHRAIPYVKHQQYIDLTTGLLHEQIDPSMLGWCGQCGVNSIDHGTCQICFTEYSSVTCPNCDEENFYEPWGNLSDIECGCGKKLGG